MDTVINYGEWVGQVKLYANRRGEAETVIARVEGVGVQTSVHPFNRLCGRYLIFADRGRLRDHTGGEAFFEKSYCLLLKFDPVSTLTGRGSKRC